MYDFSFFAYNFLGDFMKKILFFLFLLFFMPITVFADSGHSTIVMDVGSGRILYEKDVHSRRLIASITKIMTCIIVLENSSLEEEVTVGEEVLSMYGTNIYVEIGEVLTVQDLLYGLMLRSGNDAAVVLAVHTFGSEEDFVQKMNEKAHEIGMRDTHFENSHGLDESSKNYSSAYDMALLSQYAFQNSVYRKIVGTKKYTTKSSNKSYVWYNRMNLLTQYSNCIGGKNGYTPSAGKTLVSYASLNDVVLTIVSLDDDSIYVNHEALYEKYFKDYHLYTIVDSESFSFSSSFADGEYYVKDSFRYLLKDDEIDDIHTYMELFASPKNKATGRMILYFKNQEIGRIPLYRNEVEKKEDISIFQKIKSWIYGKNL